MKENPGIGLLLNLLFKFIKFQWNNSAIEWNKNLGRKYMNSINLKKKIDYSFGLKNNNCEIKCHTAKLLRGDCITRCANTQLMYCREMIRFVHFILTQSCFREICIVTHSQLKDVDSTCVDIVNWCLSNQISTKSLISGFDS